MVKIKGMSEVPLSCMRVQNNAVSETWVYRTLMWVWLICLRCLSSFIKINSEIEVSDEVIPRSNLECWEHREGDIMAAESCLKLDRSSRFMETIMELNIAIVLQKKFFFKGNRRGCSLLLVNTWSKEQGKVSI